MTITAARNPVWGDEAKSFILCEVQIDKNPTWHPFSARPTDPEKHGRDLFARLKAGSVGPYVEPPKPPTPKQSIPKATP